MIGAVDGVRRTCIPLSDGSSNCYFLTTHSFPNIVTNLFPIVGILALSHTQPHIPRYLRRASFEPNLINQVFTLAEKRYYILSAYLLRSVWSVLHQMTSQNKFPGPLLLPPQCQNFDTYEELVAHFEQSSELLLAFKENWSISFLKLSMGLMCRPCNDPLLGCT